MTFGSLFAGIGGFDLGFERAGMVCKWQVEKDPYCLRVLEKHWPNVRRYEDVKDVGKRNLESVDVICGGFPCQPFSSNGGLRGKDDDRYLWPEFYRIVREVKPKWVVVENVTRLLSIDNGRIIGEILGKLAEGGYDKEWDCLPAVAFGALHQRDRLIIIAHAKHLGSCGGRQGQPQREHKKMGRGKQSRCDGGNRIMAERIKPMPTWRIEPGISRVANGVSYRVDRIRGLGNAIMPQVSEYIGRLIMQATLL